MKSRLFFVVAVLVTALAVCTGTATAAAHARPHAPAWVFSGNAKSAKAEARPQKAVFSCSLATTFTGVACVFFNNTKRSVTGTFSTDVADVPLTVTVAPYTWAGYNVGFAVQSGSAYSFYWNSHGISLTSTVTG